MFHRYVLYLNVDILLSVGFRVLYLEIQVEKIFVDRGLLFLIRSHHLTKFTPSILVNVLK